MAPTKVAGLSKSQVNKAGKVLRTIWTDQPTNMDEWTNAFMVLLAYRAAHQLPLTKATTGLRSRVLTAKCASVEVSQRLKRIPTILDKLRREPNMALGTMQDIGGCRALLMDIDEVRRVQKRLKPRTVKVYDYIETPRESGYRGVHVIVEYDGRLTEVQLRTHLMHQWAYTVERLSGRLGVDLKSGKGPQAVLTWLKAVSEAMALEEIGKPPDTEAMERLEALRQKALPHLGGGS
jgi:putative GTP pyrophosphokinase